MPVHKVVMSLGCTNTTCGSCRLRHAYRGEGSVAWDLWCVKWGTLKLTKSKQGVLRHKRCLKAEQLLKE